MSDSEPITAEDPVSEGHDASSAETSEGSSPITPDTTTDVAPTRRAKRRPEPKAAGEPQEAPKVEEQPAQVDIKYCKTNISFASLCVSSFVFFFQTSTVSQGGWGYWGSWGKSILSTATATVATVGQCNLPLCIIFTFICSHRCLKNWSWF